MNILTKRHVSCFQGNHRVHLFSGVLLLSLLLFFPNNTRAASPNLSVEFAVSNRLTLDLSGTATPFRYKPDFYFRHIRLQPELRYWLVSLLTKHYVGITAFYSTYDVGYKERGYFGDSYAAGLTYGYNWILSRRWNFELNAGVGAIRYRLARYKPGTAHRMIRGG